tara:strand:+ start:206 stop:886 length:681 start_codon:yes stop_codon:yes gene_type:complete
MFSYVINNPNNFVIKNDYVAVPFGHCCSSALACKYANIRNFSLPFDWVVPLFPDKIVKVLENNFNDFIPDVRNGIFHNKYDIKLAHFNRNINNGIEEYKRRIDRFIDIINQPKKIYFVYINEDYLFDNNYRENEFNDKIFNEMLELEKFITNKYINIDYNILYFNFKHHNIPTNSNIINIVLHTTKLYDTHNSAPYERLRNYCGKILAELFNTKLIVGYNRGVFNN